MATANELGRIKRVDIGIEDHDIFGWNIEIDFGSTGQGTGWRNLEHPDGSATLKTLLTFFGASRFEQITNRYVEVIRESPRSMITGFQLPAVDGGKILLFKDLD